MTTTLLGCFWINLQLEGVVFRDYGWSIRYFMVLRDNYLGSFTHFQTLSEYLDKRNENTPVGDPVVQKYRPGKVCWYFVSLRCVHPSWSNFKANMLQVELSLHADGSKVLLPIELIGDTTQKMAEPAPAEEDSNYLTLQIPEIQLQLRLHDYYMGLLNQWYSLYENSDVHNLFSEMSLNLETITGTFRPPQGLSNHAINNRVIVIDGVYFDAVKW